MSAKKPAEQETPSVDIGALCRLFNLTSARIGQLAKDGVVVKLERNRYDVWQSIRNYIRYLQEHRTNQHDEGHDESYGVARARKIRADANRSELAFEIEKGRYVTRESQLQAGMRAGLIVRQAFTRLPSDITPRVVGLTAGKVVKVLEDYSHDKLDEIADGFESLSISSIGGDGDGGEAAEKDAPGRVGRKKRPPAKQPARSAVSRKRSSGTRKRS